MSEPHENRPLYRSRRRDEHVRTVSRTTRAIAALAVLGTVTFGGLAAASTRAPTKASSSAATPGTAAAAAAAAAAAGAVTGSSSYSPSGSENQYESGSQNESGSLAAPAAVPVPSVQPPVASSGGS